jgi:hypothetical protein
MPEQKSVAVRAVEIDEAAHHLSPFSRKRLEPLVEGVGDVEFDGIRNLGRQTLVNENSGQNLRIDRAEQIFARKHQKICGQERNNETDVGIETEGGEVPKNGQGHLDCDSLEKNVLQHVGEACESVEVRDCRQISEVLGRSVDGVSVKEVDDG